jgi:hypothetical protein
MTSSTPCDGDSLHSVGILISHSQARLYEYLSQILKERNGTRLHLYTRSPQEERGQKRLNKDGLWDSIENANALMPALETGDLDEAAVVERARAYQARIGETTTISRSASASSVAATARVAALDAIDGEYDPDFAACFADSRIARFARSHDNLILTPHIGGSTVDAWCETERRVIEKAVRALGLEAEVA